MFGKISDVCFIISNLCVIYCIIVATIVPIYKTKKTAKTYKIIGGRNVVLGIIFSVAGSVMYVLTIINHASLLIFVGLPLLLFGFYKACQFAIFADNKYGFGKTPLNLENVDRVKFIDIFMYENTEFYFKDGTIKKIRIPKKIFKETQQEINTRLEQMNSNSNFDLGTRVED